MMSHDLDKIRAEQKKFMPETVYVQRLTRISDGAGGWAETWQTIATTKGRIAAEGGNETKRGGAIVADSSIVVTLPYNADLRQDDRLQIGGKQYEIVSILERSEKTALRVVVKRL
jgi:SPP1 family predicted phage head-tail adaptor